MKLSKVRARHVQGLEGTWFWWRENICICARGYSNLAYQRAARAARIAHPAPAPLTEDATDADRERRAQALEEREHAIGIALLPALTEHVLLNWWGVDAELDPVASDALPGEPIELMLGRCGKIDLVAWQAGDFIYRREGELWQQMIPYSPQTGLSVLREEGCADLLTAVRQAADSVDLHAQQEDIAALGKLLSMSAGTSGSGTRKSG